MKKAISLLLFVVLVLGLTHPASAAGRSVLAVERGGQRRGGATGAAQVDDARAASHGVL